MRRLHAMLMAACFCSAFALTLAAPLNAQEAGAAAPTPNAPEPVAPEPVAPDPVTPAATATSQPPQDAQHLLPDAAKPAATADAPAAPAPQTAAEQPPQDGAGTGAPPATVTETPLAPAKDPDVDTSKTAQPASATTLSPDQQAKAEAEAAANVERIFTTELRDRIKAVASRTGVEEKGDIAALDAFYTARQDAPLWVTKTGWTSKADSVRAELGRAADWGLNAGDFEIPNIAPATGGASLPALADADVRLSMSVLKYARHARGGRIMEPAKQLSSYLDRLPQYRDPRTVLDELAANENAANVLVNLNPRHVQFERLRQKYLDMVKGTAAAKDIVILPKGPKLVPGDKHPHVTLLRQRLGLTPEPGSDETLYEPALVDAVKKVQTEKGMKPDGIVGSSTRASLNDIDRPTPEKLLANMEAWRWMPEDLGNLYVWVNIPEFMVRVVKDGAIIHEERIVSGEISKQTPVFSDEIETIYFHPRWNVPESIKVLELYPRGAAGMQRQGLKVNLNGRIVDPGAISWGSVDIRHYEIFQPPGPTNVLGVVKFTFPNKHGVYMHDTTSKHLFNEASRPFSHGCMRVRDPLKLAEVLLREDQGWDRARVDAIAGAEPVETPIPVRTKIPVHVTYLTERVDEAGQQHSFKDVYGHESRIKLALAGKWNQIVVGPDHLAPVKFVRQPQEDTVADIFAGLFGGFADPVPPKGMKPKKNANKQGGANSDFMNNIFGGF